MTSGRGAFLGPQSGALPWAPRSDMRIAHMVGRSFRCGIHARRTGTAAAWSFAWQEIAGLAGSVSADDLVDRLASFVETVDATAVRPIVVLPAGCPGLCRDECLAVSIIAASQLGACPALKACAFALLESSEVEPCMRSADAFSRALRDAGQMLSTDLVCNAVALLPHAASRASLNA
jgi:hypothetical protein